MAVRSSSGKPDFIQSMEVSSNPQEDNFLVYGDSGVGKTVLCGSDDNALIIAADKGTQSTARRGSKAEVAKMLNWKQFEETLQWLSAGGYRDYSWVITDGLTMLWEIAMRDVLREVREKNAARSEFIPDKGDHQMVHMMMKRRVETLCDMKVRTLFTALPMNIETDEGEEVVIPQIRGQKGDVSNYICGLMSAFGRMSLEEEEDGPDVRRITWKPEGAYTGKDRYNGLFAPYTDNITLPQIVERIETPVSPRRSKTATGTRRARSTTTPTRRRRTSA